MEADRFGHNSMHYLLGMLCLIASLSLFAFSFFVFPYLVFGWHYSVPDVVSIFSGTLQTAYDLTSTAAGWLIFLGIFLPAVILAVIADILSNKIDSEIHSVTSSNMETELDKKPKRMKVGEKESKGLFWKIILIVVLVFFASQFFQWAL